MTELKTIEERATAEVERLRELLFSCQVNSKRIALLAPVIENTAWMKAKLDDARAAVKDSNVVVKYNNGGGQEGLRENPLYKGYEALWKSYMAGMGRILDALPPEKAKEVEVQIEKPKTVLEMVRTKHGKEA